MKSIDLKRIKKNRTALALSAVMFVTGLMAADKDPIDTYELEQLVVTASRLEMPLDQVGSKVEVINSFDLEKGNKTFLLDNLRELPGVFVRNNGGPGGTFGITTRGLNSTKPVVLLDGIEVNSPVYGGSMINPGVLFSGNIERVEFLKGAQSSLYGANATAGVISIVSKEEEGTGGNISVGYGSYRTLDTSVLGRTQAGDLSFMVGVSYYKTKGFSSQPKSFGPEWADEDAYRNRTYMGKVSYKITEKISLYALGYYIDTKVEYDPGNPFSAWTVPAHLNESFDDQRFAKTGAQYVINDTWSGDVNIGYTKVSSESMDGSGFATSDGERWKVDTRNEFKVMEEWIIVTGAEYEREEGSYTGYSNASGIVSENVSLYLENVWALMEGLDLTLGGRLDDYSEYGNEETWRSSISYVIPALERVRFHGSYGTSFQAPSLYELNSTRFGNPLLEPEKGKTWDLGFSLLLFEGSAYLDVTYFGNKLRDKITFNDRFKNIPEYESDGIETSLKGKLGRSFDYNIAYTYTKGEENGVEAIRVPRNVYSASVTWSGLNDQLSLTAQTLIVSSQLTSPYSTLVGGKMSGYGVLNLAARYEVSEALTLWARLDNALDRDYQEVADYEMAGTSLYAGVKLSF